MKFNRHIYKALRSWKSNKKRKPLIVRGARQVGKTTAIIEFSKFYGNSIRLNLERPSDLDFFKKYTDVTTLVEALFLEHNISSDAKANTLLFIDEIQESPEAISLLRYFYEDLPQLHVIAAGSLLEHVLDKVPNFPVGRVSYLYVHPLNFLEFLEAKDKSNALKAIEHVPVAAYAHQTLKKLFNEYAIIGGMPEILSVYLTDESLTKLPAVYESIWATYKNDIEKYANNPMDARVIKHVMDVAYLYLDERVKFQNFGNSNYRSREVGEAMRNLNDARVIQLIYPTTVIEPPIKPDIKKSPRLQFLDTGIVNYELNIQADMLALDDLSSTYKGAVIPHLIYQELLSLNTLNFTKPNFWVREKTQSSSEVDLVIPYKDKIIPIEIKSGKEGKLKSLHQFIDMAEHCYAIRLYAGEFSIEQNTTPIGKKPYLLMNLPYYLGTKLLEYISYFIENHSIKN